MESMLSYVIEDAFGKEVGKHNGKGENYGQNPKALHVGFHMNVYKEGVREKNQDQYRVTHMYLYGPMNYVYVVIQEERIDRFGDRHVGKMELLCYHDSCWRDAIRNFIFKNRGDISSFCSLKSISGWRDVIELTSDEIMYLSELEGHHYNSATRDKPFDKKNPFDDRGVWAKK